MPDHEMLQYLAQGLRPAIAAELSCHNCGDLRLLLPDGPLNRQPSCMTCGSPARLHVQRAIVLTRQSLPVATPIRLAPYLSAEYRESHPERNDYDAFTVNKYDMN